MLTIVFPEQFAWLRRIHARFYVLLLPFAIACRLWRRRDADLVLFHSYCGWVFSLFKRRQPMITTFFGLEPYYYEELQASERAAGRQLSARFRFTYGWLMPAILKISCRRSNHIICQTRAEERYLVEQGWTTRERVTCLGAAASREFFVEGRVYASRARRLLVVAQWQERKGIREIAEAFTTLVRDGLDLELICAGTRQPDAVVLGDFPVDVRSRVTNLADVAHDAMPAFYRDADIFVHASVMEGSSQAQIEAMAGALPMIAAATAPAIDLLVDGDGFLLVPKRDAVALARAIRQLVNDPALRARLGRNAQQAARGSADDVINAAIMNLCDAVASAAA